MQGRKILDSQTLRGQQPHRCPQNINTKVKWSGATACSQTAAATQMKKSACHQTDTDDSFYSTHDVESASDGGPAVKRLKCHGSAGDLVTC